MSHVLIGLREQRKALQSQVDGIIAAVEKRGELSLNEAETAQVHQLRDQRRALDTRIDELEAEAARDSAAANLHRQLGNTGAGSSRAYITNEARTYSPESSTGRQDGSPRSFFQDAFVAREYGDPAAQERLQRHAREVEVEREFRATTTGSFAGLIVPQYLVDAAALVARAGRPLANVVTRLPLPEQGTTFQLPVGTTGVTVASQTPENTNVSSTDQVWSNVSLPVVTIAGQQDVSRQALERGTPGLDQLIYMDLAAAYATELDRQVINGSGASNQLLGILGTSGINAATAFGAAVSAANFQTKVAGQQQAVASTRFMAPDIIAMSPRRWGWLTSLSDSNGRPLVVPNAQGPNNAQGVYSVAETGGFVGAMLGLPVLVDASIPTNVGSATGGEDIVMVFRSADLYLYEDGDGMPRQLKFEQTLGNQLTVKLVAYGYSAFTAARYPKAVGKIGGLDTTTNGLVAPTF